MTTRQTEAVAVAALTYLTPTQRRENAIVAAAKAMDIAFDGDGEDYADWMELAEKIVGAAIYSLVSAPIVFEDRGGSRTFFVPISFSYQDGSS